MLYTPVCDISSYYVEILRNGWHKVSIHEFLRLINLSHEPPVDDGDDITPLFILDNKMMMFLDQNCLLFHVISSIPNDIDYIVFKIIDKDCITIYERLDTSNDNYDRNTTHSPYS